MAERSIQTGYDSILEHLLMLRDQVRTGRYAEALTAVVKPGDTVLDFGCGTGVLSILAARAGAERIIAVDRSRMIHAARALAARNGVTNIEFVHAEGDEAEVTGPVDVLVSEWMGHFLFAEPMLGPLVRLRERCLRPGGEMLPRRCSLHAALVTSAALHEARSFLKDSPYGIDFSLVAEWPLLEPSATRLTPGDLDPRSGELAEIDLSTCGGAPPAMACTLTASADQTVYGLGGWFDADLATGIGFSTGPNAPATHWLQMYFPLTEPARVRAGEDVEVRIDAAAGADPNAPIGWTWSLRGSFGSREGDNIVHRAWLSRTQSR